MGDWIESIAGPGYATAILWTIGALILLVIVLVAIRVMRSLTFGTFVSGGRNRRTRLAVIDATAVDSNRRLVLVRRDDIEHLILIGGPSDVVVEQNIRGAAEPVSEERRPRPAMAEAPRSERPRPDTAPPVAPRQTEPIAGPVMPPRRPEPTPARPVAEQPVPSARPAPQSAPARPVQAAAPERPSMFKRFERATASAAAAVPFASRGKEQPQPAPREQAPYREPTIGREQGAPSAPAVDPVPPVAVAEAHRAPSPEVAPPHPALDDVFSRAPDVEPTLSSAANDADLIRDLDATLLEELEVTLDGPGSRRGTGSPGAPDDDMARLLGELSGPRRS